jgi:dienelactone hydrolase
MRPLPLAVVVALLSIRPLCAQQSGVPFYADKSRLPVYLDSAGKEHPIATAAEWEKRREHVLANMQFVMGPLPDASKRVPLAVETLESVDLGNLVRKKILYTPEPGDRVPAYLFLPQGLKGKRPAVLCLHQTIAIGKGEPAGLDPGAQKPYALELARRGYVTLAPDYPNYGDYKLDPYARGYASATMKGIWNHMRAVDLLESLSEVDPKRIAVIGHSLGGHNAMFVAAFDRRIKAIVSSCGFNAFAKYYGGNLAGWSHKGYMPRIASEYGKDPKRMPFDFTEIVGVLGPRPFFINAPLGDDNFEKSGVDDCLRAAEPVYELLGGKGRLVAVHPNIGHGFPPEIRKAAYEFLDRALATPATP